MKQFRAKSNLVLGTLFLISIISLYFIENNKIEVKSKWYDEKIEATKTTQRACSFIKNYRLTKGVFIDNVNDPNETAMIGQEFSPITTDRGFIDAKLTATNPNIAALIVQFLKETEVKENDHVAITMSGSFPVINIATIAACQVLKLKPIIICSVSASSYGATDPDFTWLDMESLLYNSGILKYKSVAASIGGGADIGRGLSPEGRELINTAIKRNNVILINEKSLEGNIDKRMLLFKTLTGDESIKTFINVGSGIASIGNPSNHDVIPSGLSTHLGECYKPEGVIKRMNKKGIPVIHFLNIVNLMRKYEMPVNPIPLPQAGEGRIFAETKYDIRIVAIAVSILTILIILIFIADKKFYQLGKDKVMNEYVNAPSDTSEDEEL